MKLNRPVKLIALTAAIGGGVFVALQFFATPSTEQMLDLQAAVKALEPLQDDMPKPGPGDWLSRHKEAGQTFERYTQTGPIRAEGERRVIYVQNIGPFSPHQREIVKLTGQYMEACFGLDVKFLDDVAVDDAWPAHARRTHPSWGDDQLLSKHILDELLPPLLPDDGAVIIGFTGMDLWPGDGWNFVFGQASIRKRVGVWSIYRNGDPGRSDEHFTLCLRRTIKTAIHETGHMFSIHHCTAHRCVMNGSNNRTESDAQPLWFCSECAPKLSYATGVDLAGRYKKLRAFCEKHKMPKPARYMQRAGEAMGE